MNSEFQDVSVVMISKDEEDSVGLVIDEIKRNVPGAEIVIVDSSVDKTAEIAKQRGARVVTQVPPKGYGPAMLRALSEGKGSVIVTLDCDNTYPTEDIPKLVDQVRNGLSIASTTRLVRKPEHMPLLNYVANQFFNLLASVLFMRRVRDVHTGMRAYRKSMLEEIIWRADGPALPVELLLTPIRLNYPISETPIVYGERLGETTLERWDSTKWTIKRIFWCRFASKKRMLRAKSQKKAIHY